MTARHEHDDLITYYNSPVMAAMIGWANVEPAYLLGDETLPYVRHDHHRGRFVFTADQGNRS